jgi:hypothetical protein
MNILEMRNHISTTVFTHETLVEILKSDIKNVQLFIGFGMVSFSRGKDHLLQLF